MKRFASVAVILVALGAVPALLPAGEHSAAAAGHGGHHLPVAFVVSLVANFILFVGLLYFLLSKAAGEFFAKRGKDIREKVEAAQRAEAEARRKIEEYGRKLDELRATREEIMDQYRQEAQTERERIIERAHETAERVKADAERVLNFEMARLKDELRREVAASIVTEAERVLKAETTDDDKKRLLEKSIGGLKEANG